MKFFILFALFLTLCVLMGCKPRRGPAGANGVSAQPTSVLTHPATSLQCPAGGTVVDIGDITYVACNGAVGATGAVGLTGATGANGLNGVDGSQGPKGDKGDTGDVGSQGPQGPTGSPGVDATPVTVVNLCPGVTSYPGVFVEVALCLGGGLYGVYSANGGFLTYLPPGNYSSNAIGSACGLTIQPNCIVSH